MYHRTRMRTISFGRLYCRPSSKMVGFLDLPAEIQANIYGHVFRGEAVKFVRDLQRASPATARRATSAALLIYSRAIYADCHPFFFLMVRINISSVLDPETGRLRSKSSRPNDTHQLMLNANPALIQNIKIHQSLFAEAGTKIWFRSLVNIKSVTYYGDCHNFILDLQLEDFDQEHDDECDCGECSHEGTFDEMLVAYIQHEVDINSHYITGTCCALEDPDFLTGDRECVGEQPVRNFIAAWDWNGQPFELVAEVTFEGDYKDFLEDKVKPSQWDLLGGAC